MAGKADDLEKLFPDDALPGESISLAAEPMAESAYLPVPDTSAPAGTAVSRQGGAGPQGLKYEPSTVNETDLQSLWRELGGIWRNIALVCNPFLKKTDVSSMLQHWDLWGPLIFSLGLACILSVQSSDRELTFCVVFIVMLLGALLLTSNVVLLGGSVSFLQAVSLLGYCMFPLDLAAIGCSFGLHATIKIVFIAVSILWSMHATVPFTSGSVPANRNILAVYPLALMYAVLGWLIFIATK